MGKRRMREGGGGGEGKNHKDDRDAKEANGGGRRQVCVILACKRQAFRTLWGGCACVCCVLCVCVVWWWRMESRRAKSKEWRFAASGAKGTPRVRQGKAPQWIPGFLSLACVWACLGCKSRCGLDPSTTPGLVEWGYRAAGRRYMAIPDSQSGPFLLFASDGLAISVPNDHRGSAERSATWYRGGPTD